MSAAAIAEPPAPAAPEGNTESATDLSGEFSGLRAEVFRQTGVSLPPDDPAVALVLLNRLALEKYTAAFEARVKEAVGSRLDAIRVQAVKWAAEQMVSQYVDLHERLEIDLRHHTTRVDRLIRRVELASNLQMAFWVVVGVVLAGLLVALGILIGRIWAG